MLRLSRTKLALMSITLHRTLSFNACNPFSKNKHYRRPARYAHPYSTDDSADRPFRVMFLGTPNVAAQTLEKLIDASQLKNDNKEICWEVCGAVTQPPRMQGRGHNKCLTLSPVGKVATERGVPIFWPEKAKDPDFLRALQLLKPDLCITAAYGQWLPQNFLKCPKLGTINIHPSLLPRWRGASPVQRSLEAGDKEVGVSILWSVAKMDAGPIIAQRRRGLSGNEQAPKLLEMLFEDGVEELLTLLPAIFGGKVRQPPPWNDGRGTTPQNEALAISATKISSEEAQVCFHEDSAVTIHNKCRAFAGWPRVWTFIEYAPLETDTIFLNDAIKVKKLKILETRIVAPHELESSTSSLHSAVLEQLASASSTINGGDFVVEPKTGRIFVACGGEEGGVLEILCVQPPGKKCVAAIAYGNGFKGRAKLCWLPKKATS